MNQLEELRARARWLQEQLTSLQQEIDRLEAAGCHGAGGVGETRTADIGSSGQSKATPATCALEKEMSSDSALRLLSHADAEQERRALPRRRGNPVAVLVSRADVPGSPFNAWVIDRSPEGLCLVAEEDIPRGTWLRLRVTNLSAGAGWFEVEVRNSRPERNVWILGCQFRSALSWGELRQLS